MLTNYKVKLAGVVCVLVAVSLVSGCAWREGPPCDEVLITQTGGAKEVVTPGEDVSALQNRIDDLERRLAETRAIADSAMMTAQEALKCCRKEHQILFTENIYFDFNKSNIRADQSPVLDRVAERLKADPDLIAELSGFADAVGSDQYNMALGQKRADAAVNYLVSTHHINASRLATRTFGESAAVHPPTASEQVREADRRVTIDILGYGQ